DVGRGEAHPLVGGGRTHVGQLLFLGDVDVHVVVAGVLADDLALVDLLARADEHHAPRLQVIDGVGCRPPGPVGHQRAVLAVADTARPVVPAVEEVVEQAGAASVGQELRSVPDQTPGRDPILQSHAAGAVVHHLHHRGVTGTDFLGDRADVLL